MQRSTYRPIVAALGILSAAAGAGCHPKATGFDDQKLTVYLEHTPVKAKDSVAVFAYLTLATGDLIVDPIEVTFQVNAGLLSPGVPVLRVKTDAAGLARVVLRSPDSAGSIVLRVQAREAVASDTIEVIN